MTPPESISSNEIFQENISLEYFVIGDNFRNKFDATISAIDEIFLAQDIYRFDLEAFLQDFLEQNHLVEQDIHAIEHENRVTTIYLTNGRRYSFTLQEVQVFIANIQLDGRNLEELETNVRNIQNAIGWIYEENDGVLWSGEINDEDILDTDDFGEDLRGLNLRQLRELYEESAGYLHDYYETTGNAEKKIALLQLEIQYFAGVGDRFEGGARYFSLSTEELEKRAADLQSHMSVGEVFDYIIQLNETIDNNGRRSDMVNQVNLKLIQALYTQTFERLKQEERPNSEFLHFARILTGRATVTRERIRRGEVSSYEDTMNIATEYKASDIAAKALIYVMYRSPEGILDTIIENDNGLENIVVEDPEVSEREISEVVSEAIVAINILSPEVENYGEHTLREAGFGDLLTTSKEYSELNFDEKIQLSALNNITQMLREATQEDLSNPNFLAEAVRRQMIDGYETLNDSLSDNFDGLNGFLWGMDAEDLGLEGEYAEMFDLYQDIHGNMGLFDVSDGFKDSVTNIGTLTVLGVGIIAGAIILGPVLGAIGAGAGAYAAATSMFVAGAKLGTIMGVTSVIMSDQGYDTMREGITDIGVTIGTDALIGGVFGAGLGLGFQRLMRLFPNRGYTALPDLFFSRDAWRGAGLFDKGVMTSEIAAGIAVGPLVATGVMSFFPDNHFNTDEQIYTNEGIENRE